MTLLFLEVADTAHKIADTINHAGQQLATAPDQEFLLLRFNIKGWLGNVFIGILAVSGAGRYFLSGILPSARHQKMSQT